MIRELRGDMSQKEFGKLVGLSQQGVAKLEREGHSARIKTLEQIAQRLGLKLKVVIE